MNCLFVFSLAILGACSAAPCGCGVATVSEVCGSALPGRTIYAQTPVIENPTRIIPSCIPSTSVSQSCHCLKTIVRPQIRNEIITVPQVDRIVRVVPSPVVEAVTVNLGENVRGGQIPTCGVNSGIVGGVVGGVVDGVVGGVVGGSFDGVVGGSFDGVSGISGVVGGCQGFGGVINSGLVGNTFVGNTGLVGNAFVGNTLVGNTGCGC